MGPGVGLGLGLEPLPLVRRGRGGSGPLVVEGARVEAALAPITGSVQVNIKAGRVLNFDVRESVKVLADDAVER